MIKIILDKCSLCRGKLRKGKTEFLVKVNCEISKGEKRDGESFSDAIDRLLRRKKINLADYFGTIEDDDLLRGARR